MGQSSKESLGKKDPSAETLNELMELLLKLNAKIREKIAPRRKKEETGAENTEMVIIILNQSPGTVPKAPRPEKPKPLKNNWVDDLCQDLEHDPKRRKHS